MLQAMASAQLRRISEQDVLRCLDSLPPFSPVVRLLLASLSHDSDDVPLRKVAELIEEDTVISGKVLGFVNSPLYYRGKAYLFDFAGREQTRYWTSSKPRSGPFRKRVWNGIQVPSGFSMSGSIGTRLRPQHCPRSWHSNSTSRNPTEHLSPDSFMMSASWCLSAFQIMDTGSSFVNYLMKEKNSINLSGNYSALLMARFPPSQQDFGNFRSSVQTAVLLHETPPPEVAPPEEVDFSLADVVHTADRSVTALGFSTVDVTRAGDAAESLSQLGLDDAKVRAEFQNQFDSLS